MTSNNRLRKSPPHTPDSTPFAAAKTPAPPDRVVTLPAGLAAGHARRSGVPDLFGAKLICAVMLLLFGGLFVSFPIAFAVDKTIRFDFVGFLLMLLLMATLGWCLAIPVRAYRNIGGWFEVDETGFRYGVGPQKGNERAAVETRIDWRDVVCNPEFRYDVGTDFVNRKALVKELRFWRRLPTGEVVEHRLPLRLSTDTMRCLRFCNRAELLKAVMLGFASRPELRFNADAFADVGLDPETWHPMRAPRWIENVILAAAASGVCVLIWFLMGVWPTWLVITASMILLIAACILLANRFSRAYPQFNGVIGFRADNHVVYKNPTEIHGIAATRISPNPNASI